MVKWFNIRKIQLDEQLSTGTQYSWHERRRTSDETVIWCTRKYQAIKSWILDNSMHFCSGRNINTCKLYGVQILPQYYMNLLFFINRCWHQKCACLLLPQYGPEMGCEHVTAPYLDPPLEFSITVFLKCSLNYYFKDVQKIRHGLTDWLICLRRRQHIFWIMWIIH